MQARKFTVSYTQDAEGHRYSVDAGEPRGPFEDRSQLERDLAQLIVRWRERARALGGSVVRAHRDVVLVTLPDGVPCEGGEALYAEGKTMGPFWLSHPPAQRAAA